MNQKISINSNVCNGKPVIKGMNAEFILMGLPLNDPAC